jgi:hypothetical protein
MPARPALGSDRCPPATTAIIDVCTFFKVWRFAVARCLACGVLTWPVRCYATWERSSNGTAVAVMVLEQNRHGVLEAADGVAGVVSALVDQPEIAFVGVDLPQLDGYEVAPRSEA